MPEDPKPNTSILEWLHTKTGLYSSVALSLLALGIGAWLREIIPVGIALPLSGFLLAGILALLVSGARAASRQRATISKLEKDVDGLKSDLSSLRNAPSLVELQRRTDTEDKLMIFIMGAKGKTLPQIAAHLGMSEVRTEVVLSALAKDLFVYRQGYTEGPSYWCLGDAGKRYLTDNDLIP